MEPQPTSPRRRRILPPGGLLRGLRLRLAAGDRSRRSDEAYEAYQRRRDEMPPQPRDPARRRPLGEAGPSRAHARELNALRCRDAPVAAGTKLGSSSASAAPASGRIATRPRRAPACAQVVVGPEPEKETRPREPRVGCRAARLRSIDGAVCSGSVARRSRASRSAVAPASRTIAQLPVELESPPIASL